MKKKNMILLTLLLALLLPGRLWAGVGHISADGFVINNDDPYRFLREEIVACVMTEDMDPMWWWPCGLGAAVFGVTIEGPGINTIAYQPWDGKILIGGEFTLTYNGLVRKNLARLEIDGRLDTSFSPTTDLPVHAIALAPDPVDPKKESRIYIGGSFTSVTTTAASAGVPAGTVPRKGLARLKSGDGSLDPFDPGNVATAVTVNAIAVQPENASVVVGGAFTGLAGAACRNLARLSYDGTVTGTFGEGPDGAVNAVALQEGLVVIGGEFTAPRRNLARYWIDDSVDPSFSPSPDKAVRSLAVQADRSVVLGGDFLSVSSGGTDQVRRYLARVTVDGKLDDFTPQVNGLVRTLAVRPEGGILAGGDFTLAGGATHKYLARFTPAGGVESAEYGIDAPVHATVVQQDGDFLAGGKFEYAGGKHRTRLARFYPEGVLDDDSVPLDASIGEVFSLNLDPKGYTTILGDQRMYRVGRNFEYDASFTPPVFRNEDGSLRRPSTQAQLPDGRMLVGGPFEFLDGNKQRFIARLTAEGAYDSTFKSPFHEGFTPYGAVTAIHLLPTGSVMSKDTWVDGVLKPKGTPLEEGMMYVFGDFQTLDPARPMLRLLRLKKNGDIDLSFNPPTSTLTGDIYMHLLIQPDDKILLFKNQVPQAYRMETDGTVDDTFVSPRNTSLEKDYAYHGFWGSTLQRDGQILIALDALELGWPGNSEPATTIRPRGLARLNNLQHRSKDGTLMVDGSIDTDYAPASIYNDHDDIDGLVQPYSLIGQADGKTFLFGMQTKTSRKEGGYKLGDWVMRFGTDGQVDDLPSLMLTYPYINAYASDVQNVALQTDGKVVVAGYNDTYFFMPMERYDRTGMLRFSNDTPATQEVIVSPEGTSITWLRGGSSPEIAEVQFEESAEPAGPWTVLGRGKYTDGGWMIDEQDLPRNVSRYVRAIGWHQHGQLETSTTMIESVRRYHLKPILTVTARGGGRKTYGDKTPETLDYDVTGFVDGDTRSIMTGKLAREAGENAGSYAIKQGTLYAGPKYLIHFTGASFSIDPATLTVRANDYDKVAGEENPPFLDYTATGFVNGDTRSIMTGNVKRDEGEEPGIYTIRKWTLSAGPNYVIDFTDGIFTINAGSALLPQEIIFNPMRAKTFGDADFDPGATATSGLPVEYSSSNPAVAQVVDGRIRVLAPGSADITATRGGDDKYEAAEPKTQPLLVNPPPWHALAFDGVDDVLRVNDGAGLSFDGQPGFAIETWLRLDGPQASGAGLLSKGSGARGWQLVLDGDRIAAEITDGVSAVGVPEGLVGKTSLNDGAWHHVALSVDRGASGATLYLDGRVEVKVTLPAVAASTDNTDPLRVGVDRTGTGFFKGAIDELRLWKAPRTETEIRSGQSRIIQPADAADLVAYFHLDEGDAALANPLFSVAPERTARSADGSLLGFALSGTESNWVDSGAFLPLLETSGVSAVTSGSASSGATVYPNYYDATDRGICWGTSANPVLGPGCLHSGSGEGNFTLTMTGLEPGTTYHVRAFAVNQIGTAYGNDLSFPTPKLDQTIEAEPLPPKTYGDGPFTPVGRASSDLPVTYTSGDPKVAVVEGGQIRITGAGSVTIMASQGGDTTYNPAPSVPLPLTVAKAPLEVRADNKSKVYLQANPALTVSYRGFVNGDTVPDLSGSPTVTTTAVLGSPPGSYPISITRGDLSSDDYAFNLYDGTLTVAAASQEIKFGPLRARTFGDADFDPGATASSGLPVEYATSKAGVAAVVGGRIRVVAPGSANITASQDGNPNYSAAANVTQPLTVNPPPWNGLAFDGGNDVVTVADAAQLNFGASRGFTIETWLRLDGSQPDGTGLVSKGSGAGYQLTLHDDRIAAEISDGVSTVGVAEGLVGKTSLNDGAWHHVALSVDRSAGSASLYLDGRLETELSNQALGGDTDNTASLRVGVDRRGSRFFNGAIDELRLWKSVRSREEIRSDVSRIVDPLEDRDLVAYFHLDEGDAGLGNAPYKTAPERTATGAHGALSGFALSGAQSNWVKSGAFLPLLETAPAVVGDSGSASSGGLVYANYYPATDRGLCWGASVNPATGGSCVHKGSGAGAFSATITDLKPGGTYHVRAFAVNEMGTAYGNDVVLQMPKLDQKISLGDLYATYGDPPFLPGGTASSGLPVSYTSADPGIAVIVNGRIQITGAGSTTITASQGGDATYNPAPDLPVRLVVAKAPLTVRADDKARAFQTPNPPLTFSYSGFVYGEGPSVLSGQPVLSTTADPASPVGEYPITVDLSQLVSNNYRFIPVNGTLTVLSSCQEIIFPPIPPVTYGDPPVILIGGACSGLEISFVSSNPQVAQVSGKVVTITGAGSVVITASQSGSGSVEKAPDVSRTLVVNKRGQSLTFPALEPRVLGDRPFTPGATSSSGLPVSYQSSDPAVATVSGSTVTIAGAGTTVITALQEGDANHNPALPASRPLTVREEGTAPALTLSTLASGSVTADPVLNITGTANDASGIASVTVNGVELSAPSSLFSSAVALAAGDNSITVAATDGAGNRTTGTITVTMDAAAPAITASAPADNSVSNTSFFTAAGTVTAGSSVAMTVNGASPQSLAVSGGSFTGSGYLAAGLNTIEFSASLDGRSSRIKRSVIYAPGKPYVALTAPAEDMRTGEETMTLKGIAGAEGSAVSVSLQVGGATLTPSLQQGGFQQQITLQSGETRISASVTDSGGNSSVAWRNIIRVEKITGDLNGDGRVDISDAAAAMNISLGIESATPQALARGDVAPLVDGVPQPDGKIDVGDVLVILRKVVGLASF